jgi:hypothetical protein
MLEQFVTLDASHIGYTHYNLRRNNQDAHISGTTTDGVMYGFVLDGCGSRKYSEISRLVCFFLATRIQELTKVATLFEVPELLWAELLEFYRNQLLVMKLNPYLKDNRDRIEELIKNYFLHTVLGFVSNDENVFVMTRGDGNIVLNYNIDRIDRNDKPDYPAFFLLPWTQNSKDYPPGFQTQIHSLSDISHLFVTTDGVTEKLLRVLLKEIDDIQTSVDVQMLLNREFDFGVSFDDDATIAGLIRREFGNEQRIQAT